MNDGDLMSALAKIMPMRVADGPDCAEVYFSDGEIHSTQAMTMNPQDWIDIQQAYDAAWNTRTDAKAGSENTTAFLRDLAQRIFINATPQLGFDQGDVDRLYAIASVLADAPPVKQSLTSDGEIYSLASFGGDAEAKAKFVGKLIVDMEQSEPVGLDVDAIVRKWLPDMETPSLSARSVSLKAAIEEALHCVATPARTDDAGQPSGDVAAMREAVQRFLTDFEHDFVIDGAIVDSPDPMLKLHYITLRAALQKGSGR